MNSQLLFWIYLTGGIVFLILFLSGRKSSRPPTRLNLKAEVPRPTPPQPVAPQPVEFSLSEAKSLPPGKGKPVVEVMEPLVEEKASSAGKSLNCLFMYNGHDWDAYQVLGVPAGSPLPVITQVYQDLIKNSHADSYEFFETAYKAILKSTRGYRL